MNGIKIVCVCKCGNSDYDEGTLEINFRDSKIYYVCPKCRKTNKMQLKLEEKAEPLPRIKRL